MRMLTQLKLILFNLPYLTKRGALKPHRKTQIVEFAPASRPFRHSHAQAILNH